MENKPVIEINKVSKSFPGVQALKDVSMKIYPGEVVSIIGQNGAGKSTLMNVLGGILKPDSGEIKIDGSPVDLKNPIDSSKKGIAYIHQELALFNNLTVAENFLNNFESIKFLGLLKYSKIEKTSNEVIKGFDPSIRPNMKIGKLSVGQKQVVEISRAICSKAKVIIFDEPTASLSHKEKKKLFELIKLLKKKDYAIIYITHLFEEIFNIGDRAYVLRDGECVGEVKIRETNLKEIVKLMLGKYLKEYKSKSDSSNIREEEVLVLKNINSENGIKDLSLSLKAGEKIGIWGLLGSGRTELLRTILGFDKITGGSIFVRDNGSLKPGIKHFAKYFGYVPENRREEGLFLSLSVLHNTSIGNIRDLSNRSGFIKKREEKDKIEKAVKDLNIRVSDLRQSVKNLSGGNQQKVILSRWLLYTPKVFILDDPTKGLDVGAKSEVHRIINNLTEKGISVIMVSSDIDELLNLSDRIMVIYNKQVVLSTNRAETNKELLMQAAMGHGAGR